MSAPAKTKAACHGCRDDYYNQPGNSNDGECWMFKGATMTKRKRVHINQRPPWKQEAQWCLSCFNEPQYVYVGEHQER